MNVWRRMTAALAAAMVSWSAAAQETPPEADPVGASVTAYFATVFARLKDVADKQPTVETFRAAMQPLAEHTDGFFGGSLIDTNFVIRQVYNAGDFLARGYDLKKVKPLEAFWNEMRTAPAPQLSEPARGNVLQPRLVSLRYPVMVDGRLQSIVSIMVRTEAFLKATGLDRHKAYRITCRGVKAEEEGTLPDGARSVTLQLPATVWTIDYAP